MDPITSKSRQEPEDTSHKEKRLAKNARQKARDGQAAAKKWEAAFNKVYPPPPSASPNTIVNQIE
jgi:hypothetical protein